MVFMCQTKKTRFVLAVRLDEGSTWGRVWAPGPREDWGHGRWCVQAAVWAPEWLPRAQSPHGAKPGQRRWLLTLGGSDDHLVTQLLLRGLYILLQLPCRSLPASPHHWNVFLRWGYQEPPEPLLAEQPSQRSWLAASLVHDASLYKRQLMRIPGSYVGASGPQDLGASTALRTSPSPRLIGQRE